MFASEGFETTNPAVGVTIAILDATGVTKKFYDWVGKRIDDHQHPKSIGGLGPDNPMNPNFHKPGTFTY